MGISSIVWLPDVVLTSPVRTDFSSGVLLRHLCSWKACTLDWRNTSYANKIGSAAGPSGPVCTASCGQAKGNCCKQRRSSCFVSCRCRVSGLARPTDKLLFSTMLKYNHVGLSLRQFVVVMHQTVCTNMWMVKNAVVDGTFTWVQDPLCLWAALNFNISHDIQSNDTRSLTHPQIAVQDSLKYHFRAYQNSKNIAADVILSLLYFLDKCYYM